MLILASLADGEKHGYAMIDETDRGWQLMRRLAGGPPVIRAEAIHLEPAWNVFVRCRDALRMQGIEQWDDAHPTRDTIADDIAAGSLYVMCDDRRCHAIVALDERHEPEFAGLPWTAAPALVIHRLCVDPDMQGRGLGGHMLDFVERHAASAGYATVRLDAYTGNPASLAFYRRRGYRDVGQVHLPRHVLAFQCFELPILQLAALEELAQLVPHQSVPYWLFGGWAVDFHAGRVTREHDDIDIAIWSHDRERMAAFLLDHAWVHRPNADEDGYTCYERGGVRLEVAFLACDEHGHVATPLREGRGEWPEGSFGDEVAQLRGVHARVVGRESLIADKSVVRSDAGAVAKDRADVASLRRTE